MQRNFYLFFLIFISSGFNHIAAYGGAYPFPQNVTYAYGQKPDNALAGHALMAYTEWKTNYYDEMPDNTGRVFFNSSGEVVSEGIAYGMLLAAYADDKAVFDRLWRFYLKHSNSNGIMHWKISVDDKVVGSGGATDAEEDAAMALIVAHYQWGSTGDIDYLNDARNLIDAIMRYEVEPVTFRLKSGDGWGSSQVTNPSYLSPAYYRIFADLSGDDNWLKVIATSYAIIEANAHPDTGLVSDWCLPDGSPANSFGYNYTFDASRFPWRMAMDYLWFGDERAKNYCIKMSSFVQNTLRGSQRVNGAGYSRAGNSLGGGHNPVFVATFALTGMASGPEFTDHLNNSYTDTYTTDAPEYFGATLRALSLFMLTGNFYRLPEPVCTAPALGDDILFCTMEKVTLNSGLTTEGDRLFKWNTGHTGPEITADTPGVYILRVDSAGCVHNDTIDISVFEVSLGPDVELINETVLLQVSPARTTASYQWSTGESGPEIRTGTPGTYWVRGEYDGCIRSDTVNVNQRPPEAYKLYPNPSYNGNVRLFVPDPELTKVTVSLYSSLGQFIQAFDLWLQKDAKSYDLNLAATGSGVYLIRTVFYAEGKERINKAQRLIIR